jgi:hypothetical protein
MVAAIVYVVMAVPAVIMIGLLTLRAIKDGKLPKDTDITSVLINVFFTWPKVYYLTFLNMLLKVTQYLHAKSTPPMIGKLPPPVLPVDDDATQQFLRLVEQRINENEELSLWMYRDGNTDEGNDMGFDVTMMAGTTYIQLHKDPRFLYRIRQPDGSYDDASMARFESLHPWMVFDLVTAHPHYMEVLPEPILECLNVVVQ